MTTIFPAAVIPVIIMGIVLEFGKIGSVLFLHRHWQYSPKLIKTYLIISIFVLMLINSMGIFGYLSRAHIEQDIINNTQSSQIEIVQSKLDNENSQLKDVNNQIVQIDTALTKLTEQGKAQTSLRQADAQRKERNKLVVEKTEHLKVIEDLTKEKINEDNENAKVSANFGPLLYITDAIYGSSTKLQLESTVRWIICILVFVFDPLALTLLIASQYAWNNRNKLTELKEDNIMKIDERIFDEGN